ncbi:MAG: hypothetical protein KTR25_17610 [Myxococcales bacterium]|nr:hypothetical protein [Myxococcales bacterium]
MVRPDKDRNLFGGSGPSTDSNQEKTKQSGEQQALLFLEKLNKELSALKASYELYLMGIERTEPLPRRTALKKRLRQLLSRSSNNTAFKFKLQQLKARMASLENYWHRSMQQREAGTYHRDVRRLKLRAQHRQTPKPTAATSSAAPQKAPIELSDDKLRELYSTYLLARKRCGESTDLPYEALSNRLKKQVPELMQRTGASSIEFKVVIRNGKAVLKALPQVP